MNATIRIDVGLQTRVRHIDETWKETITYGHVFHYTTDLSSYQTITPQVAQDAFDYKQAQSAVYPYAITTTHVSVWVDNVTHPTPARGVVKLPKGNRDTSLSHDEFDSTGTLLDHINEVVANLRAIAKY